MLREVRMALLEADGAARGARVRRPGQGQGAGRRSRRQPQPPGPGRRGPKELTALMGGDLGADSGELSLAVQPPAVILMAGLQGAGKTTTTGKLARWLSEHTHQRPQEESAGGVGRRLPSRRHRAVEGRGRAGRRGLPAVRPQPEARGHRPQRGRPHAAITTTC